VRPARRAENSLPLVVLNVKAKLEIQHSIPPLSLHDLLRESFTIFHSFSHRAAPYVSKPGSPEPGSPESLYLIKH
jgi:hypothetical protein